MVDIFINIVKTTLLLKFGFSFSNIKFTRKQGEVFNYSFSFFPCLFVSMLFDSLVEIKLKNLNWKSSLLYWYIRRRLSYFCNHWICKQYSCTTFSWFKLKLLKPYLRVKQGSFKSNMTLFHSFNKKSPEIYAYNCFCSIYHVFIFNYNFKMDLDLWFTQTREIINVRKYIFSFL